MKRPQITTKRSGSNTKQNPSSFLSSATEHEKSFPLNLKDEVDLLLAAHRYKTTGLKREKQ